MDNPQLRLIDLDTKFEYYSDENANIYRLLKHKPRSRQPMYNKICLGGRWFKKLTSSNNYSKNYWRIEIQHKNGRKSHPIHRLAAIAFIPNPNNYPQINHLDSNKNNNHISNLEWTTNRDNLNHSLAKNLRKTVDSLLINILLWSSNYSQKEIAEIANCCISYVEKFKSINKVQRPEHYCYGAKINESRSKLVGTKWYRNRESN